MHNKNIILQIILLTIFLFSGFYSSATHNRAGEITYRQMTLYTYEFTLVTYTYAPSAANEDRDYLTMNWGDESMSEIARVEIIPLPDDIQKNVYVGLHTFPGTGVFEVTMSDPNRNADIVNIPNSVYVVFTLKTTLLIDPNLGFNNTPELQNPPIDKAALGEMFVHNPSAFDTDGDSISYEIAICLADNGNEILGYEFPEASDTLYVDPISGNFVWDAPVQIGEYNVAIKINEWRNGIKIGSIIRDMQIEVEETDNQAPEIEQPNDYCITVGENLSFTVTATDPDNDNITLTANGGPFTFDESPATFPEVFGSSPLTGNFSWNTACSHIREQPYTVVFRAEDDNPEVELSAYSESKITIVPPAPENLTASPSSNAVHLSWDDYQCNNASGFIIYRRHGSYDFTPENCETGMPAYAGYTVADTVKIPDANEYTDTELPPGYEYCYRITSYYEEGSESYVSNEVCAELEKGTPAFINASINNTDTDIGSVSLRWVQATEFDHDQFPGPYKYELEASEGIYGEDYQKVTDIFGISDTTFTEENTDTKTAGRSYKLTFLNQNGSEWEEVGAPSYTSVVFIEGLPENKRMIIKANENTPWTNYEYTIYKKSADTDCNTNSLPYDSIGTSDNIFYTDSGLSNDLYYWYKVRTTGGYDLDYLPETTINFSQEICVSPEDLIAPCPVSLNIDSDCDLNQNYLNWSITDTCASDIASFLIYYTKTENGDFKLLTTLNNPDARNYTHIPEGPMGTCYIVTAQDSAGNMLEPESLQKSCIDICHNYELPNVFTPNSDGKNDLFIPFPYNYVEKIELKIFTRWGNLVFETENPDINWDGTDIISKKPVTDGVYYYLCDVYEQRLTGIEVRNMTGFIHIFANKKNTEKP